MSNPEDPARAALARWLASDEPWLTVVAPPGFGAHLWLQRALRALPIGEPLRVVRDDDAPADASGGRVVAVGHRRHRHPDEAVIELAPLPRRRAVAHARTAATRVGVALADSDADALIDRVGGHPRAIELLVRRLAVLTLPELIERLDAPPGAGRDPLLNADVAPWSDLREALDRAVAALPDPARAVLGAAALFADPFTVADLSRIQGADALSPLQILRDHTLLYRVAPAGLQLLPVIRRYVRAFVSPPSDAVRARHHAWRADLAAELAALAWRGTADAADRIAAVEGALQAVLRDGISDDSNGIPDDSNGIPDDSNGIPDDSDGIPNDSDGTTGASKRRAACDAALALSVLHEHRRSIDGQRRVAGLAVELAAHLDRTRVVMAHVAAARANRLAGETDAARHLLARVAHLGGPDTDGPPAERFQWCHERCALANVVDERGVGAPLADAALGAARALADPHLEARAWINLGVVRHGLHDLDGAVDAYSAAWHISRRIGATRLLSISALNVCLADVWRGRLDAAQVAGEEARSAFAALSDRRGEGTALNNLGMIALERGDLDTAARHFEDAEACHRAIGFRQHVAYARLNQAEVALERGQRAAHDALVADLETVNAGHPNAAAAGPGPLNDRALALHLPRSRARSALAAGELEAAAEALASCRARTGEGAVAAERVELELLAVEVALARGDRGAAEDAWRRADAAAVDDRRGARLRVELLAVALGSSATPIAVLAEGLRARYTSLAIRRTLRAVWAGQPREDRREALARCAPAPALCLDPPQHAMRLPDGRWVSLERRRLVWNLLQVLFDAEAALAPDAVIAAVWPGEVIQPEAASNRLYNAVALLRKAGLGQRLERVEDGYRLDPELTRVRIDEGRLTHPG